MSINLTFNLKQAAAFLLLGIAIGIMLGAAGAYSEITDSIEAGAADGVPISIGGTLYDVREVNRGMNLSETWERLNTSSDHNHIWLCSSYRN